MLKLTSKSFDVTKYQDETLKQHIQNLMDLSQEIITEKLQRQQERQRKVSQIQQQFTQWAEKKQSRIRQKLQKSGKIKEDHLSKIVKKCKDKDRYLGQKLKNHHIKKKETLKQAWKMAEKYKEHFQEEDKNTAKTKSMNNTKSFAESHFLDRRKNIDQRKSQYQINPYLRADTMKSEDKQIKDSMGQFGKSRERRASQNIRFFTENDEPLEEKWIKNSEQKLKQAFLRFKNNLAEQQNLRIQQLGERYEKIEKSRNRRYKLTHKKRQTHFNHREPDQNAGRSKILNKSQRVHSQSIVKEKRVRDWSQATKNKREQFFQTHLQNGNHYLENSKLKFLKTTLAKKITFETIEKKLYLQRLGI